VSPGLNRSAGRFSINTQSPLLMNGLIDPPIVLTADMLFIGKDGK
jgi:hypothetical protein